MSQIAVWRGSKGGFFGYWHHGILCPDRTVIHFTHGPKQKNRPGRKPEEKPRAIIMRTSLQVFRMDAPVVYTVKPKDPAALLPPDQIVQRAESRLGEDGYSLWSNNCENFARWCVTGEDKSRQIGTHTKFVVAGFIPFGIAGAVAGIFASGWKMAIGDRQKGRLEVLC